MLLNRQENGDDDQQEILLTISSRFVIFSRRHVVRTGKGFDRGDERDNRMVLWASLMLRKHKCCYYYDERHNHL